MGFSSTLHLAYISTFSFRSGLVYLHVFFCHKFRRPSNKFGVVGRLTTRKASNLTRNLVISPSCQKCEAHLEQGSR